jgi:hypothetical protein
MRRRLVLLSCAAPFLVLLVLFTSACGTSSSSSKIRLVNATPDENDLDMLVDSKSVATSVSYGAASAYTGISSGSRQLEIEPTGSTNALITRNESITPGKSLTLISLNYSFNFSSLLLTDDNSAPTSGNFKLRVINASPGMGAQDLYVVVADGTDIGSVEPTISSMGFGDVSSYFSLPAGDYRVIFAAPGQKFINLDSGKLTYAAGQIRTGLGLDNPVSAFQYNQLTDLN